MRFLDLMSLNLPEHIDLIKCDIEGAEEFFIPSYLDLLRRCSAIVIELHHDRCETTSCIAQLIQNGFWAKAVIRDEPTQSTILYVNQSIRQGKQ